MIIKPRKCESCLKDKHFCIWKIAVQWQPLNLKWSLGVFCKRMLWTRWLRLLWAETSSYMDGSKNTFTSLRKQCCVYKWLAVQIKLFFIFYFFKWIGAHDGTPAGLISERIGGFELLNIINARKARLTKCNYNRNYSFKQLNYMNSVRNRSHANINKHMQGAGGSEYETKYNSKYHGTILYIIFIGWKQAPGSNLVLLIDRLHVGLGIVQNISIRVPIRTP